MLNKTECDSLKKVVTRYLVAHGLPANVRNGVNGEIARWFSKLIDGAVEEAKLLDTTENGGK